MKKLTLLFIMVMALLLAISFAGCKGKSADTPQTETPQAETPQAENPVEQYGTGLINSEQKAEKVKNQSNLVGLQQAVITFRASNGRFPESLEELKGSANINVDISQFDYDPRTGHVSRK
jgi:hypothetical protein